jgi:hypothetical protein
VSLRTVTAEPPSETALRPARLWRRHLLSAALLTVLTLALAEGMARVLFGPLTGQPFDAALASAARQGRIAVIRQRFENPPDRAGLFDWQPYVGYVGRPGAHPWGVDEPAFNDFGMLSRDGVPYPSRTGPGVFVVGVLGGSLADLFANNAREALQRELVAADPSLAGRRLELVSLATGGFKQPQQLFHLEYALLSGFQFDAVVNIDGFNDLVLAVENRRRGIQPLYPSGFHVGLMSRAAGGGLDPDSAAQLDEVWRHYRQELAVLEASEHPVLDHSALVGLLAAAWSRHSRARIDSLQYALTQRAQQGLDQAHRGPPPAPTADELAAAAATWRESSELLRAVLEARGIPYVHLLQPNQYVPDSKPMSDAERQLAVDPANPWGQIARAGYQHLIREGAALRAGGEAFHDETMLFGDVTEPVYVDNCCHLGPRGNELLAGAVARAIAQARP